MPITPQYNIVPHGIKRHHDGEYYAIFKMVVTVEEFNGHSTDDVPMTIPISSSDWNNFKKLVNNARWTFNFLPAPNVNGIATLKFTRVSEESNDFKAINALNFYMSGKEVGAVESSASEINVHSFGFGLDIFQNDSKINFVNSGEQAIVKEFKPKPVSQFQTHLNSFDNDMYHSKLHEANKFASTEQLIQEKEGGGYDFRVIYGTILDEPYLAENHYGLVREIAINTKELLMNSNTEQKYTINIDGLKSGEALYVVKEINKKYYHGLEKMFFFKGTGPQSDFKDIKFKYQDPYKISQGGKLYPDGIYALVAYHTDSNGLIVDPFAGEGIRGCNVVVSNKKKYHSLSYHKITYTFGNEEEPVTQKTSGCMNPRSVISIEDKGLRSNLLFAWRGDNLMVNREVAQDEQTEEHIKTEIITNKSCENRFITESLFAKVESLIPSTQIQLITQTENPYRFFVRTVGYTKHYLPLDIEVEEDEKSYTLTVEDVISTVADETDLAFGDEEYFKIIPVSVLPIRSVDVIGNKKYNNPNPGFVDNGNHMVLDLNSGENKEVRYIYPPSIKLEDIKFFGYLYKAKIKNKEGGETNAR